MAWLTLLFNVGTKEKVDCLTQNLIQDGYYIKCLPIITGDGYYESVVKYPEDNTIELTTIDDFIIKEANSRDLDRILYLRKCCYLSEAEIYNNYNIQPICQNLDEIENEYKNSTFMKL